jgi:hypothetical protein
VSESERKRPKLDPYWEGEPHPLPKTRAWMEDYRHWVAAGCPTPEQEAAGAREGPPDLQALIDRAGRRYAASIGEDYIEDPFKQPPHQGGYAHITPEEWAEFDRQTTEWQARRRARP